MFPRGIRLFAAGLFLTTAASARHLPIRIFTTAQGLPRNYVSCMVPGTTGVLWLCTSEGLARFDGHRFRVFGIHEGLPSRNVLAFAHSSKGGSWVVTDRGVCRLRADANIGQPCKLLRTDGTPYFSGIFESKSGDTWIVASSRLLHVSADETQLERTSFVPPPLQQILMVEDGQISSGPGHTLLIGTENGLYDWTPGGHARDLSPQAGEIGPLQTLVLPSGIRLIGATNGLFEAVPSASGYSVRRLNLPGINRGSALIRRRDGAIWIAGSYGLARLEVDPSGAVNVVERLTEAEGLPHGGIELLFEDGQSNLWGSSEASGIFRLQPSGFKTWSRADGLGEPRISSVFEDPAGQLVVTTTWNEGIDPKVLRGSKFHATPVRLPPHLASFGFGWHQIVVASRTREWWIATGKGVLRYAAAANAEALVARKPLDFYDAHSALGCENIFRIFEDSGNDIWISCLSPARRLIRWSRKTGAFHEWSPAEGWPRLGVENVMRQSTSGVIWLCTASDLVRFRDQRFELFRLPGHPAPAIRDLLIDRAERVWIATLESGIFRWDSPEQQSASFRHYTVDQGLSTNSVRSLVEDRSGFIYAGTALGVDRIDPRAPLDAHRIRHFGVTEGLPDSEQNTSFRDKNGHLWFGSLDGLSEFTPGEVPRAGPPDVYVTRVRVHGEDLPLPWEGARHLDFDLSPDRNQAEIEFSGSDFRPGESLLYQYRLGAEQSWGPLTDTQTVNYASLPAGPLRFEVRAVDDQGMIAGVASVDLRVEAPIWKRWWFLASSVLMLLAVVTSAYNYRVRNLLALERLRVRIATDLHDDIGASLTQISILSEVARRSGAAESLADVAEISRVAVQDMSDIVWAINPRHDRFEALVKRMRRFSEDTLGDIRTSFEASLPAESSVPLSVRRPLYLVFKEAVNNVAKHSGAASVAIRLRVAGTFLVIEVEDDGCGFTNTPASGEGLLNIGRRMRENGGGAEWLNREGGGTCFRARFPMRTPSRLSELIGRWRRPHG